MLSPRFPILSCQQHQDALVIVQQWKSLNSYHSRHRLSHKKRQASNSGKNQIFPRGTEQDVVKALVQLQPVQVCNEGHIFIHSETPAIFQVHVSPRPLFSSGEFSGSILFGDIKT